jgi:hypothetical protein
MKHTAAILSIFLAMAIALSFPHLSSGATFCALTVHVLSESKPANVSKVRLFDMSGKVVFDEEVKGADVRICDFGFGPHKLVVGWDHCSPTTVSDLRLRPGRPITLLVRLNMCTESWGSETSCRVYLRIREPGGAPIGQAHLSFGDEAQDGVSDEFGRFEWSMNQGAVGVATVTRTGYIPSRIDLRCPAPTEIEKEVVIAPVR